MRVETAQGINWNRWANAKMYKVCYVHLNRLKHLGPTVLAVDFPTAVGIEYTDSRIGLPRKVMFQSGTKCDVCPTPFGQFDPNRMKKY